MAVLLCCIAIGQTCVHDDLSRTLRIITHVQKRSRDSVIISGVPVSVTIIDKASKKTLDVISFTAIAIYPQSFSKCSWVRSYTTGKNRNAEVMDTDFGDVVVADLNFDSREDIAVKWDDEMSGNYYRFYIQGKDGRFKLDSFLTDTMQIIPTYLNKKKRTLTGYQRAGALHVGEQVYRLDIKTNKWSLIWHRFIPEIAKKPKKSYR